MKQELDFTEKEKELILHTPTKYFKKLAGELGTTTSSIRAMKNWLMPSGVKAAAKARVPRVIKTVTVPESAREELEDLEDTIMIRFRGSIMGLKKSEVSVIEITADSIYVSK